MKSLLYPKLAISGIKKNRKIYLPYILSCIGMVMMFYIIHSLSYSPLLHETKGGSSIEYILSLGKFVIAIFSLIFLLYTNSFLTKKRYKEFGLYNILGMDKKGIGKIVLWESFTVAFTGLFFGIALGILFSKFAELGLLNTVHKSIDYRFTVSKDAVCFTALIYLCIFLLIMLKSLIAVIKYNPLELLKSARKGEKAPKSNPVFALLGIIILLAAYYIAVSIKSPLTAIMLFFIAVIMVIAATYLIFISGSVSLCRMMQKSKRYYYKKQHFVSVSSMSFRMKRNGAGLASICILATMVLIMLSSTASLYFGEEDTMKSRFPKSTEFITEMQTVDNLTKEKADEIKSEYEKLFKSENFTPENPYNYRYASISGMLKNNRIEPDSNAGEELLNFDNVRILFFIDASDYNRIMHKNLKVEKGEAYLYETRCNYDKSNIIIKDVDFKISGKISEKISIGEANTNVFPSLMLVIDNLNQLNPLDGLTDSYNQKMLTHKYYYGYDSSLSDKETANIYNLQSELADLLCEKSGYSYLGGCISIERESFYTTFGGLFFIGIMLSAVFIFAAAMIIYYKQVSEGFEDKARFEIMQKVGMTKKDIKKSINSQVLTVFFAPLIFAGLHLAFAFPLIWKLLQLFNLQNLKLVILITVISFVCFGIFYSLIYKITAKAYYSIVSSQKN